MDVEVAGPPPLPRRIALVVALVLLSAAFGLVRAGLIDQSLFNPDFVDGLSWDRDRLPTHVPELGLSAKCLLGCVAGHGLGAALLLGGLLLLACIDHRLRRPVGAVAPSGRS
ncbi:hypothetical protein AB0C69_25770 [Actinomadura sp. NPDC048032]|uniref:hypothetical protein n=1 Tax=Actinomadura sp. NPDC048032 TaxID=3155747 RepID=UPI0034103CF7